MRYDKLIMLLAFLVAVPTATAQDEHAGHHSQPDTPATAKAHGTVDQEAGMTRIEALMAQIRATRDATQRGRLLDEHLAALQDQIKLIRSQPRMKMGMMKRGGAQTAAGEDPHAGHGDGSADSQGGGMMGMHRKMEGRVDMLERLIEQLIEREAAGSAHAHH